MLYAIAAARMGDGLGSLSLHGSLVGSLGEGGYDLLGVGFFVLMAVMLVRATRKG